VRQLFPDHVDDVDLLRAYAVAATGAHVRVNFVTSADGAATVGGLSDGLSGTADKRVFGALRTLADVVLVGAGTARAEGYGPAKASADRQQWRLAHGYAAIPPIAVVSGGGDLDVTTPFFTDAVARPIVYTLSAVGPARLAALRGVADVVTFDGDAVPVDAVVADLAGRGLRRVLCEGGPHLFGDLLAAGLVDELALTVSPLLAGGSLPRIVAGDALPVARRMTLAHVLTDDGFLFLRYVAEG
jgi:riboflavin biosynthesis pyrimidine reductase